MKKIVYIIIGLIPVNMAVSQTLSPELISSSGDSFNNTSYQLDWSIGECVTASHSAGTFIITQGFHQNTYIITATEDLAADIDMFVYPNPTSNFITVNFAKVLNFGKVSMVLTVSDNNGKVLLQEKISEQEKQLDFSAYTSGVYFLTLTKENQIIKSFKIIKN